MDWLLRVNVALAEKASLVLSTHTGQFTASCCSSPRESKTKKLSSCLHEHLLDVCFVMWLLRMKLWSSWLHSQCSWELIHLNILFKKLVCSGGRAEPDPHQLQRWTVGPVSCPGSQKIGRGRHMTPGLAPNCHARESCPPPTTTPQLAMRSWEQAGHLTWAA